MVAAVQRLVAVGIGTEFHTHVSLADREKQRFVPRNLILSRPHNVRSLFSSEIKTQYHANCLPATFVRIELSSVVVKGVGNFLVPTYFITGFESHCSDVFNLKRYWEYEGVERAGI
jgi:hypothetical protein